MITPFKPHAPDPVHFALIRARSQAELRRQEEEAKKLRLQGQNPDAGAPDGDFMSEAKDWAGELISGQTGTGRVLVSYLADALGAVPGVTACWSGCLCYCYYYHVVRSTITVGGAVAGDVALAGLTTVRRTHVFLGLPRLHTLHSFPHHLFHRRLQVMRLEEFCTSRKTLYTTIYVYILFFQRSRRELHSVEQEQDAADRPGLQHLLHGLLLHPLHCGQRQVLVHAGAVLLRRLLHDSAVLRLHLPGQDLDRWVKLGSHLLLICSRLYQLDSDTCVSCIL